MKKMINNAIKTKDERLTLDGNIKIVILMLLNDNIEI